MGTTDQNQKRPSDEPTVYTLCGAQGCCPTVTVEDDNLVIADDHGGSVRLTRAEWLSAVEQVKVS